MGATTASAVPLQFDNLVGVTDGSNVLGATVMSRTALFRSVATDDGQTVDARITATLVGDTEFADVSNPTNRSSFGDAGYIPDYSGAPGGPEADLGFLYYGNGLDDATDGISFLFEFFDGSGDYAGSFANQVTVGSLDLAIYDVDGEATQSEYFTAYKNDGLISYAVGNTEQALVATDLGDSVLFQGPGQNYSESDATGAVLLNYTETQSFRLDFGSVQSGGPTQNAVFSAIDGDLSFIDIGDFTGPIAVAPVPVPPSVLSFIGAIALMGFMRIRRKSA
ncbi:MAG: hypothetical protein AAF360_15160 [Pseudomonadota bacterium]